MGGLVTKLLVDQSQVVVGIMEHDLDGRIGKHGAEGGEILHSEWVDHRRLVPGGELQQVDPVQIFVKGGGFGVHRHQPVGRETGDQPVE